MRASAIVIDSQVFDVLCAVAIFANAVLIGWMSDYQARHINDARMGLIDPQPAWASWAELGFSILFAIELTLRLLANGVYFFRSNDWKWNVFDCVLVVHSIFDLVGFVWNSLFLRVLRLFKIVRFLRIIRFLRSFRSLRLITHGIVGSVSSMFWSMILLLGVTFVFGIVFLQATIHHLESSLPPVPEEEAAQLRSYWGSVLRSMLSLFKASTGGTDWDVLAKPLLGVGWLAYALFVVYMAFFLFAVMNAVTSLFVESTMNLAAHDQVMTIQHELEKKDKHVERLRELFRDLDTNQDGLISYSDLSAKIRDPRLVAWLSSLGIDACDVLGFFRLLSGNLRHPIDFETFVIGCIQLRGEARALDMHRLLQQQRELAVEIRRMGVTMGTYQT